LPKKVRTPFDEQFKNWIIHRRDEHGLTQKQLAAGVGISYQQVQKYEKGTNSASIARFMQIAHFFEADPSILLKELVSLQAAPASGFAEESRPFLMADPQLAKQVSRLGDAFKQIRRPNVRRELLALVISLTGDPEDKVGAA
jgi:transcriptional regulator with XRE-family HTH domain